MQRPSGSDDRRKGKWWQIAEAVQNDSSSSKGVEILNAGTWLIVADDGLPFLGLAIRQAVEYGFQYRIFFLPETPELPKATV